MQLAYRYTAKNAKEKSVNGMVYAANKSLAIVSLKRTGFKPRTVDFALSPTVKNVLFPEFNGRELMRFYRTLGRMLDKGRPILQGIKSAAEYMRDEKLRQAALTMMQSIDDGNSLNDAMVTAGFSKRDAIIIKAADKSGKVGSAFTRLAKNIEREEHTGKAVKRIFRMQIFILLFMYFCFYGVIRLMLPKTAKFMRDLHADIPDYSKNLMAFAEYFNAHWQIATIAYLLVPVIIFFAIRSQAFKNLMDRIKLIHEISIKTDQGSLWASFALLYGANFNPADAARMLKEAAARKDSRQCFVQLEKQLRAGQYLHTAVEKSNFPTFIVDGVGQASISEGDLEEQISEMCSDLEEEITDLIERLKENLNIASLAIMALAVMGFFFATVYPIMSTSMKNV